MLCVLFWGFSFISIKIAVLVIPPMSLGALRFAVAVLLLLAYRLCAPRRPGENQKGGGLTPGDLPYLAGSGLSGVTFYFFFENNGVALVTASEASIIMAAIPVLTMSAEWLTSRLFPAQARGAGGLVRLGRRHWLGALVSVAGVILVARVSFSLSGNIAGYLYMGGAALCWVAYGFFTRPLFGRGRSQSYIVFWQNVFGLLGFLPFAVLEHAQWQIPSTSVMLHVLFLGLCCSAAGYLLYAHAFKALGAPVASVFLNLIPAITAVAGFFILGDRLSALQWTGAALVLTGVYLTVLPGFSQARLRPGP